MSSARLKKIPGIEHAPYIGALLRMAYRQARTRILEALADQGFGEINQAYFGFFQYPPIDRMRPSDLAKRLNMSKQAANHLLGQLEKSGYLERRREPEGGGTIVCLTERGWQVVELIVATMRDLEGDWHRQLGKRRFAEMKAALRQLAGLE